MKRAQKLKPFILELAVFLFVVAALILGLFATDSISITIRPTMISILFFFVLAVWIAIYVVPFAVRDFWAVIDAVFRCYEEVPLKFVEQFPYRASTFTDVRGKDGLSIYTDFYRVITKDRSGKVTLIAPEYYELKPGNYIFTIAKHSKIIVDVLAEDKGA